MEHKYDIGDFVIVCKVHVKKHPKANKIVWEESICPTPRLGRVVGMCKRWDGVKDYDIDWETGYSSSPYFVSNKVNTYYLVRFGWFNKPVCIMPENMRLAVGEEIQDLPNLHANRKPMSEKVKQFLREDSKNWPRKSNGQFAKGNILNYVKEKSNDS